MAAALPLVAIDAVMIGLIALIFAFALFALFRPFVTEVIGRLPIIGQAAIVGAYSFVEFMQRAVSPWVDSAIWPMVAAMDRVWAVTFGHLDWSTQALENTFNALWRLRYGVIPALFAQVYQYAAALYGQAIQYAATLHAQALQYAAALFAQAIQYAAALFAQAIQYAAALFAQAIQYAATLHAQVLQYALQLYNQALQYAAALFAQAIGFAEDVFGRAIDYERQLYGQALDFARQLAKEENDFARYLYGLAIAFATAAVAAVAARVEKLENSECQKFCAPLGGLGGDLQALGDLMEAGFLVELAAQAVHNPGGFAQAIRGDLEPLVKAGIQDVEAAVNLARQAA